MNHPPTAVSDALVAALAADLDLERQLVRAYQRPARMASSPRWRQALDQGLALKRRHEIELSRLIPQGTAAPEHEPVGPPPGSRELLSWLYDRERALALRYRDQRNLTEDDAIARTLHELSDDQARHLVLIKNLYRESSFF